MGKTTGIRFIGQEPLDENNNPVDQGVSFAGGKVPNLKGHSYEEVPTDMFGQILTPQTFDEFDFGVTHDMNPEEIRARRQSTGDKWGNASVKMLGLAGTTLLDNTVGTIIGLGTGAHTLANGEGFMEGFIHNPVSEALYEVNEEMEKLFPNYYTRKEQHSPWYENLNTANFWADTILKNFGFAAGAYLSGMGIGGVMMKGLKAEQTVKNIAGRLASTMGKSEDDIIKLMKAGKIDPAQIYTELGKDAARLKNISLATELTSSVSGAIGESRIEAIHAYHEVLTNLQRTNPEMDPEEMDKAAKGAANITFATDLATLSLSNYTQFKNVFSRGYNQNKRLLNNIQRSADGKSFVESGGKLAKAQAVGNFFKNPLMEGWEEQQQYFNTEFSKKYMELENDPDAHNVINLAQEAAVHAFAESYGNIDSYDNFFAGAFTGGVGMPNISSKPGGGYSASMEGGVWEPIREYRQKKANTKAAVDKVNSYFADPNYKKNLAFLVRDISLERSKTLAAIDNDQFNFKNAEDDQLLNMVLAFDEAGKIDKLIGDVKAQGHMSGADFRKAVAMNKEEVHEELRQKLGEEDNTIDPFKEMNDSDLKSMLQQKTGTVQTQIKKILELKDKLETKASNKIDRTLIPRLLHHMYTVERSKERLDDIKRNTLDAMTSTFTTPDVGKSRGKESDTKVEKVKRKTVSDILDYSLLEEGNESLFLDAFENWAEQNPFEASTIEGDVRDAVKLSRRIREFGELYVDTFRNNKQSAFETNSYIKTKDKIDKLKQQATLDRMTVGTRIAKYNDNGEVELYEVHSFNKKGDSYDFTLKKMVSGVDRPDKTDEAKLSAKELAEKFKASWSRAKKLRVSGEELLEGIESGELLAKGGSIPRTRYEIVSDPGVKRFVIDENEISPESGRRARAELILEHFFKMENGDGLSKAFDLLNKLAPEAHNAPVQAQIQKIANLFYFKKGGKNKSFYSGYLANLYTYSAMDKVLDRINDIENIYIREALRDKIIERVEHIKEMKEQILKDYGAAIDQVYRQWDEAIRREKSIEAELERGKDKVVEAVIELEDTIKKLTKEDKSFKEYSTTLTEQLERGSVTEEEAEDLEAIGDRVKALENKIKNLEATLNTAKKHVTSQEKFLIEAKDNLDRLASTITTLEEYRDRTKDDKETVPFEQMMKYIERLLRKEDHVMQLQKRKKGDPLSAQEKVIDQLYEEAGLEKPSVSPEVVATLEQKTVEEKDTKEISDSEITNFVAELPSDQAAAVTQHLRKNRKAGKRLVSQFQGTQKRRLQPAEWKEKKVTISPQDAYIEEVESVKAIGIDVDEKMSLGDLKRLHKEMSDTIKERETAISIFLDMIKQLDTTLKNLKKYAIEHLNKVAKTNDRFKGYLKSLENIDKQKETLYRRLALVSTGLGQLRAKRTALQELMARKELMEFLESVEAARGSIRVATEKTKDKAKTSKKDDKKGKKKGKKDPKAGMSIEDYGSSVDTHTDEEGSHINSPRPFFVDIFRKTAGSDQPGDTDNETRSQRRWFRFAGHNAKKAQEHSLQTFQANDSSFRLPDEDLAKINNLDEAIFVVLAKEEGGKVKYLNVDGSYSDTFDGNNALYTSLPLSTDHTEEGNKYHTPSNDELQELYGKDKSDEELYELFEKDLAALAENYETQRKAIINAIRKKENPMITITGVSKGVENRTEVGAPASEFLGKDSTVFVATTGKHTINGKRVSVPVGHTMGINNENGNYFQIKPRSLTEKEQDSAVNVFKVYVKRLATVYNKNKGKFDFTKLSDLNAVSRDGKQVDTKDMTLFKFLSDLVWWQGDNVVLRDVGSKKAGDKVNTNDDVNFHFIPFSNDNVEGRVIGGMIQIGHDRIPLLDHTNDKIKNGVIEINPDLEGVMKTFLTQRFRNINSKYLKDGDTNVTIAHHLDEDGNISDVYSGSYKSYIGTNIGEIFIAPQPTPVTEADYENAVPIVMNKYFLLDIPFGGSFKTEYQKHQEKMAKARAKARAKKKADAKRKASSKGTKNTRRRANTKKTGRAKTGPAGKRGKRDSSAFSVNPQKSGKVTVKGVTLKTKYEVETMASRGGAAQATSVGKKKDDGGTSRRRRGSSGVGGHERRATSFEPTTLENTDEMEAWFKSKFGDKVKFNRTYRLINGRSWGLFHDAMVTVVQFAEEGTTFHEAFHTVMGLFLTENERQAVFKEFMSRSNAEELLARKKKQYSDYTHEELIEEILADEFMEYEMSGGKMSIPIPKKQKSFFQELLDWIGAFFGRSPSENTSFINEVYNNLREGTYSEKSPKLEAYEKRGRTAFERRKVDVQNSELWKRELMSVMDRMLFFNLNNSYRNEFNAFLQGSPNEVDLFGKVYEEIRTDFEEVKKYATEVIEEIEAIEKKTELDISDLHKHEKLLTSVEIVLANYYENQSEDNPDEAIKNSIVAIHREESLNRHKLHTELDLDDMKDPNSRDSAGVKANTYSRKKSSSTRMRIFMSGIPETVRGNKNLKYTEEHGDPLIKSELFDMPIALPFGKAFNIYSNMLGNARTIEDMYHKIKAQVGIAPGAQFILNELKLDHLFNGKTDEITHSDLMLILDFAATFSNQVVEYDMALLHKGGRSTIIDSSQETATKRLLLSWKMSEELNSRAPESADMFSFEQEVLRYDNKDEWKAFTFNTLDPAYNREQKFEFYQALGIYLDDETKKNISNTSFMLSSNTVNGLQNYVANGNLSLYERRSAKGAIMEKIANEVRKFAVDNIENSHINLEGSQVYNNTFNHYMSFIKNAINSVKTKSELLQKYPFFNDPFVANSLVLQIGGEFFDAKGERTDKKLSIKVFEGSSLGVGGLKKPFSSMSPSERMKADLDMMFKNKYKMIRAADNSSERYISFGDMNLVNTATRNYETTLIGYLRDELNYVDTLDSDTTNWNNRKFLKEYETAKASNTLMSVITNGTTAVHKALDAELKDVFEGKRSIDDFIDENGSDILAMIDKFIELRVDKLVDRAEKYKLIVPNEGGKSKYSNYGFIEANNKGEAITKQNIKEEEVRTKLTSAAYGHMISTIEQQKIFTGHPIHYLKFNKKTKQFSVDNMIKRMAGMVGPKRASVVDNLVSEVMDKLVTSSSKIDRLYKNKEGGITSVREEGSKPVIRTMVFDDVLVNNPHAQEYFSRFDYNNMEETDGQGIVTLDTYRDIMLRSSLWNLDMEKLYQWEIQTEFLEKPGKISFVWDGRRVEIDKKDLYTAEGDAIIFNPLKPQYFGPLADGGYIPSMYKFSVYPLIPSMIKGRNLQLLDKVMHKNNVGIATFETAVKVGRILNKEDKLSSVYTQTGNFNTELGPAADTPVQHIYYEFFGIQVNTGNKKKKQTAYGTQVAKQIMYDLKDGKKGYKKMSFDIEGMEKPSAANTEKVVNAYNRLVGARLELGKKSLMRKMGITLDTKRGLYVINNIDRTIESLKKMSKERDLPLSYITAFEHLKTDDNTMVALGIASHPARNVIEPILLAEADKLTAKKKVNGGAHIQAASTLFESIKATRTYHDGNLSSNDLAFYTRITKGGKKIVTRMQVYLPHYFKELIGEDIIKVNGEFQTASGVTIDKDVLELIGFRIPTSGLNTIESIEIKGFLPEGAGEIIVMPSDIVKKAGSDYDVDKLNLYIPHYIKRGNKIERVKFYTEQEIAQDEDIENELYSRLKGRLIDEDPKLSAFQDRVNEKYKDLIREKAVKVNQKLLGELLKEKSTQRFIDKTAENITDSTPIRELNKILEKYENMLFSLTEFEKELEQNKEGEYEDVANMFSKIVLDAQIPDIINGIMDRSDSVNKVHKEITRLKNSIRRFSESLEDDMKDNKKVMSFKDKVAYNAAELRELRARRQKELAATINPSTWRKFQALDIFEKNGIEAIENEMFSVMDSIVRSPENWDNLVEPISSEMFRTEDGTGIADDILALKGEQNTVYTLEDLIDLDYMMDTVEKYLEGLAGIGISALQATNHHLAQHAGWRANMNSNLSIVQPWTANAKGKPTYGEFASTIALRHNNSGGVATFDSLETVEGETISSIFNNYINAFVDIANDAFVIDINSGTDTLPTILMLVRAGVPLRDALYFINQPIIVDYMKEVKASNNNMLLVANRKNKSKGEIAVEIFDNYGGINGVEIVAPDELTLYDLEHYLRPGNQKGKAFQEYQLQVFNEFLKYNAMGQGLSGAINATTYDTKANGRSTAQHIVRQSKFDKVKEDNFIEGFENIFEEGSYLQPFKEVIDDTAEIYRELFPEYKGVGDMRMLRTQLKEFMDQNPNAMSMEEEIKITEKIINDYILYMVTYPTFETTSSVGESITVPAMGKNSNELFRTYDSGHVSTAAATQLLKDSERDLSSNLLLDTLIPVFTKNNGEYILMFDQATDPSELEAYINSWRELFDYNDPAIRKYAFDLMKTALLQTGIRKHPRGFTQIAPPEEFMRMMNDAHDAYQNRSDLHKQMAQFTVLLDLIIENYSDNTLIPRSNSGKRAVMYKKYGKKAGFVGKSEKAQENVDRALELGVNIFHEVPEIALNKGVANKMLLTIDEGGREKRISLQSMINRYIQYKKLYQLIPSSVQSNTKMFKGYHVSKKDNPLGKLVSSTRFVPSNEAEELFAAANKKKAQQEEVRKDKDGGCKS